MAHPVEPIPEDVVTNDTCGLYRPANQVRDVAQMIMEVGAATLEVGAAALTAVARFRVHVATALFALGLNSTPLHAQHGASPAVGEPAVRVRVVQDGGFDATIGATRDETLDATPSTTRDHAPATGSSPRTATSRIRVEVSSGAISSGALSSGAASSRAAESDGGEALVFWLHIGEWSPPVGLSTQLVGASMTVVVTQFGRHATQTTTAIGLSAPDQGGLVTIVVPEAPDAGLRDRGAKAADMILGVGSRARLVGPDAVVGGATVLTTLADPEVALDLQIELPEGPVPVLEILSQDRTFRVSLSQPCSLGDAAVRTYCFRAAGLGWGGEVVLRVVRDGSAIHVGRYQLDVGMNSVRVNRPG